MFHRLDGSEGGRGRVRIVSAGKELCNVRDFMWSYPKKQSLAFATSISRFILVVVVVVVVPVIFLVLIVVAVVVGS